MRGNENNLDIAFDIQAAVFQSLPVVSMSLVAGADFNACQRTLAALAKKYPRLDIKRAACVGRLAFPFRD